METNYKIPFIVHQTFYTTNLPLKMFNIIQNNKITDLFDFKRNSTAVI